VPGHPVATGRPTTMQVMQTRLLAIFAALFTAAALLAGCGSSEDNKNLPDAATLLKQSAETTKSQSSVHLLLTVNGSIPEFPIESLEADLTTKPAVAAQGKANILLGGQRLEGVGFVVVDGTLYGALTAGSAYQDFGPAADIYDASVLLSPDKGLANVLSNFSDPKAEARETINGVKTIRVTGTVSQDAVNKIVPQVGATGAVPGTAWIAEEGNHELIQAKLDTKEDTNLTMTLSDWGKPVTVTKPAA